MISNVRFTCFFVFFTLTCVCIHSTKLTAQCAGIQIPIVISIVPDQYPNEISWTLTAGLTTLASGGETGQTVCVDSASCLTFNIFDSSNDGICCGYGNGSYTVILNGDTVASGGNYGSGQRTTFNCPPGQDCHSAISVSTGSFAAPQRNQWYSFAPDSSGMYFISTCGLQNNCNTKLWVYDHCQGLLVTNSNEGTIYYDDNSGGCGEEARINALLQAGKTYFIRVGDSQQSCNDSINWSLNYNGPVIGCMDPLACNFNPIATISNGECYYPGNPNCPDGRPDLIVVENEIKTSIFLSTIQASNCQVIEGCLTGYGNRDIIRFTTHIKNIGNADYYIGTPETQPTQFSFGNCHGHWHYEGYAEYTLYDLNGQPIPVGFKNGFCVLDLECGDGGNAQYGCGNMGISKQCGDIYDSGLDCQWVDITDVDTGTYTLVVKVNWDNSPDALGRTELALTNNWAQVCVKLGRDEFGNRVVSLVEACEPYVDCNGQIYGSSTLDCEGTCGGLRQMGDINNSGSQEMLDSKGYVDGILGNDIAPSLCNDINQDNRISVFDAALISGCVNFGQTHQHTGNVPHNHCQFPGGLLNPADTVGLQILDVNFSEKYIDIGILNPTIRVLGYEFDLSGVTIWNVENLANAQEYPVYPEYILGGQKVISLSYQDSTIRKYTQPTPVCRVHYYELTDSAICISKINDIISGNFEQTVTQINGVCWEMDVTGVSNFSRINTLSLAPNPAEERVTINLQLNSPVKATIQILNSQGQLVFNTQSSGSVNQQIPVDLSPFSSGIYLVNFLSEKGNISKHLVVN
jgi:hypothetical protein